MLYSQSLQKKAKKSPTKTNKKEESEEEDEEDKAKGGKKGQSEDSEDSDDDTEDEVPPDAVANPNPNPAAVRPPLRRTGTARRTRRSIPSDLNQFTTAKVPSPRRGKKDNPAPNRTRQETATGTDVMTVKLQFPRRRFPK